MGRNVNSWDRGKNEITVDRVGVNCSGTILCSAEPSPALRERVLLSAIKTDLSRILLSGVSFSVKKCMIHLSKGDKILDLEKIGRYIAGKRKSLGLTQRELAKKLNMWRKIQQAEGLLSSELFILI